MKKKLIGAAVLGISMLSIAATEDIRATVHNLSTYSDPANGGTNEVCVFCHTPHGSNSDFTGAPLWNKPIDPTITFQVYGGGMTTGGTTVDQPGDVSRACLSCHDGVSGVNVIINKPGSGGWDPAGQIIDYRGSGTTSLWRMPWPFAIGKNGAGGNYDLRDDHPIGVVYRGDDTNPPASLKPTNTPLPAGWNIAGDKDGNPGPTIGDLLRGGKIECVSCHNPHLNAPRFLRSGDGNTNSNLCRTCHDK
ncbi:doubled CXXCH domain-containing protein [Persephonella hydrogeniphila]|uniref:Doubled CXXCH domain-containing protein n=1 Tax=Persephonella hydrogeniphila TaxID=198703 RepID=A0A285NP43_9AQUI|nr:cytochrome c3 family protein [Persephonella hydrogeniphila]SNZ11282.1 doubled CXXCH domain-containing protein [Persephonella hydrogeniphila]